MIFFVNIRSCVNLIFFLLLLFVFDIFIEMLKEVLGDWNDFSIGYCFINGKMDGFELVIFDGK